ncbi:hypothetical protein Taro_014193 [Colocasia esculenta]|uniref:Uncharacterized protein n=1 Tax=Colocasia esculenta TaxID=4460 RepID=A0A843UI68_COLES|nr:hypothetical protein [Colocasia esculenta]
MSEVQGGSACGPSTLWRSEVAVPVVRDVGACVVRLWSHVAAPMFRELLWLGGCVPSFASAFVGVPTALAVKGLVSTFPVGSELLLLGAHAASVVVVFAHAAVGFVLGLRIRVGVSQRLREPTCCVAFTGAGLWSTEPVEGVLALLVVPVLLGLPGCYRSRCGAFDRVSGRGTGQIVFLIIFRVSRLRWWDFVCLHGWEACFVSRALRALPDGSLGEAGGVPSSSAFHGLLGVVVLSHGIWCRVAHRGDLCGFVADVACSTLFGLRLLVGGFWQVSCGESFLLAVLFRPLVQLCCILPGFGAGGGTLCSCSSGCFVPSGALVHCVASWVAPGACVGTMCCTVFLIVSFVHCVASCSVFKALSFPPLGHYVLADALWLYHYRCGVAALPCLGSPIGGTPGFGRGLCPSFPSRFGERVCPVGVPCFGLGPFEVDMLASTSAIVSFPVQLPTS